MRAIEQKMLNAIRNGKAFYESNTAVEKTANGCYNVRLFGNTIAEGKFPNLPVRFNLRGWISTTTLSRINALGGCLRRRNGAAYNCGGKPVPSCGWFNV